MNAYIVFVITNIRYVMPNIQYKPSKVETTLANAIEEYRQTLSPKPSYQSLLNDILRSGMKVRRLAFPEPDSQK